MKPKTTTCSAQCTQPWRKLAYAEYSCVMFQCLTNSSVARFTSSTERSAIQRKSMGHSRFPQGLHSTPFLTLRMRVVGRLRLRFPGNRSKALAMGGISYRELPCDEGV